MTTLVGYDRPTLEEALEHHGVKGMHWGQRKAAAIAGHNVRVEAKKDLKKTQALKKASHKGVVAERKAHREVVKAKAANSPAYHKAQITVKRRDEGKKFAAFFLKRYATYKIASYLLTPPRARQTSRGASFVASKPSMMNATLKNGAFKVTTL